MRLGGREEGERERERERCERERESKSERGKTRQTKPPAVVVNRRR